MSAEITDRPVRWRSRGIGLDETPGCFVCGDTKREPGANSYMHNIAAMIAVTDEAAALACFEQGARMGYRHADRACPQIKVGACTAHLPDLARISDQWFITAALIAEVTRSGIHRVEYLLTHPPEDREESRWLSTVSIAARKARLPHGYTLDRASADEIAATARWDLAAAGLL